MSQVSGKTIWLWSLCFLEPFGEQRSELTLCKCSCCRVDLLVNEGHGSGARGHRGWPSMCMRVPLCLPPLRPPFAERAFDCVRADNVWSSVATESPLGERWQRAGSQPIRPQRASVICHRPKCVPNNHKALFKRHMDIVWMDRCYLTIDWH